MHHLEESDTGAQAEILTAASAIGMLADVIRHCDTSAHARGILIEACSLLQTCAGDAKTPLGDSVPNALSKLLGRTPQLKAARRRNTQLARVEEYLEKGGKKKSIGKSAIIEMERYAIDALLEKKKSYGEIARYLNHTYRDYLKKEKLSPFSRSDVHNKLTRDRNARDKSA